MSVSVSVYMCCVCLHLYVLQCFSMFDQHAWQYTTTNRINATHYNITSIRVRCNTASILVRYTACQYLYATQHAILVRYTACQYLYTTACHSNTAHDSITHQYMHSTTHSVVHLVPLSELAGD